MTENEINYTVYNNKHLLVIGDKERHQKFIKTLAGRWNSRAKNSEPGWLVPKEKEEALKEYILSLSSSKSVIIDTKKINIKSRKSQSKYHRAISESEDSDTNSESEFSDIDVNSANKEDKIDKIQPKVIKNEKVKSSMKDLKEKEKELSSYLDNEIIKKKKLEAKNKFEMEKNEYEKRKGESKDNPITYYKSFNKKPIDFKKINNLSESEDNILSSSDDSSESEDSFPSPETPKKRKKYQYNDRNENFKDLFDEMKSLQRQIYELQLDNKKLKSKNVK
jgi:hypothetical protein